MKKEKKFIKLLLLLKMVSDFICPTVRLCMLHAFQIIPFLVSLRTNIPIKIIVTKRNISYWRVVLSLCAIPRYNYIVGERVRILAPSSGLPHC